MSRGLSTAIDVFLMNRLSERHYDFWKKYTDEFTPAFHRGSSSSGRYHLDSSGCGHTLEEHTLELLKFVDKLACIFGETKEEQTYDLLLLAAALHDIQKYGERNELPHTTKTHGVDTANFIRKYGTTLGLYSEEVEPLAGMVELHDGRWNSGNPGRKPVKFTQRQLFIHLADMASSRRILVFEE